MRIEKPQVLHKPTECQEKKHYSRWEDADDVRLLRLWGRYTVAQLAVQLGRRQVAVKARAYQLLGSYAKDQPLWSQADIVRATGYDKAWVARAAKAVEAPGARGLKWVIGKRDYDKILAWLLHNAHGTKWLGHSYQEACSILGCSKSWLYNTAKLLGIDARKGSRYGQFTEAEIDRLRREYALIRGRNDQSGSPSTEVAQGAP